MVSLPFFFENRLYSKGFLKFFWQDFYKIHMYIISSNLILLWFLPHISIILFIEHS